MVKVRLQKSFVQTTIKLLKKAMLNELPDMNQILIGMCMVCIICCMPFFCDWYVSNVIEHYHNTGVFISVFYEYNMKSLLSVNNRFEYYLLKMEIVITHLIEFLMGMFIYWIDVFVINTIDASEMWLFLIFNNYT